jgi:lipopolysaccharide/colanic/teichoic acid biosynthesis glycosyltransferase
MLTESVSPPVAGAQTPAPADATVIWRPIAPRYAWVKRAFDLAAGAALLLLSLPAIGIAWAAVRLTSDGPGLYSQTRVGRHGRVFRIYKLRTMTHNCEVKSGVRWATRNDVRVTPVGWVLRKLHVDELPQLWNILCGEMSLIGPRPERPEFVGPFLQSIPGYSERLQVRPGLTGLAQIQLPPDSCIESVQRKLVLDRCYVNRLGASLDFRILAGTVVYLLGLSYAGVRDLVRLPNPLVDGSLDDTGRPETLADTVIDSADSTMTVVLKAPVKPSSPDHRGTA